MYIYRDLNPRFGLDGCRQHPLYIRRFSKMGHPKNKPKLASLHGEINGLGLSNFRNHPHASCEKFKLLQATRY